MLCSIPKQGPTTNPRPSFYPIFLYYINSPKLPRGFPLPNIFSPLNICFNPSSTEAYFLNSCPSENLPFMWRMPNCFSPNCKGHIKTPHDTSYSPNIQGKELHWFQIHPRRRQTIEQTNSESFTSDINSQLYITMWTNIPAKLRSKVPTPTNRPPPVQKLLISLWHYYSPNNSVCTN